ncbi:hypothetical protein CRG98_030968 [Punica granatum]|uniref:Uncharacterized protein n=1 Tax=Punica granatum TaxID=22663 RepID=A0A2I0IY75_PUNGR|nr:hypothetical protein CRG98_030968 [Punica granatum]
MHPREGGHSQDMRFGRAHASPDKSSFGSVHGPISNRKLPSLYLPVEVLRNRVSRAGHRVNYLKSSLQNFSNSFLANCVPLSEIKACGTPKWLIKIVKNLIIAFSEIEATASASTHLKKYSTTTMMNFRQLEAGGSGPTMLMLQVENGHVARIGQFLHGVREGRNLHPRVTGKAAWALSILTYKVSHLVRCGEFPFSSGISLLKVPRENIRVKTCCTTSWESHLTWRFVISTPFAIRSPVIKASYFVSLLVARKVSTRAYFKGSPSKRMRIHSMPKALTVEDPSVMRI